MADETRLDTTTLDNTLTDNTTADNTLKDNTAGTVGEDAAVMVNPVKDGEADAPQGMGMATSDTAPMMPTEMPTGTHGGGMGSGSGLDTDDLQDGTDGVPESTKSAPTDGAGTGNYANEPGETDDEMTGVVGEVNGDDKAAGGI